MEPGVDMTMKLDRLTKLLWLSTVVVLITTLAVFVNKMLPCLFVDFMYIKKKRSFNSIVTPSTPEKNILLFCRFLFHKAHQLAVPTLYVAFHSA